MVATIDVPFFVTPPDVIVWGQRHFVPFNAVGEEEKMYYMEAFAWFDPGVSVH